LRELPERTKDDRRPRDPNDNGMIPLKEFLPISRSTKLSKHPKFDGREPIKELSQMWRKVSDLMLKRDMGRVPVSEFEQRFRLRRSVRLPIVLGIDPQMFADGSDRAVRLVRYPKLDGRLPRNCALRSISMIFFPLSQVIPVQEHFSKRDRDSQFDQPTSKLARSPLVPMMISHNTES
jgi:hypothetical protein